MNRIYICNIGGGHGHFLQWVLDKFCTETDPIDTIPFDSIGASHLDWWDSGKFRFVDDTEYEKFLHRPNKKNIILIKIEDEILYWERSCMYRAGNATTNLFDEGSIAKFLTDRGSDFPEYCKEQNISIKTGYTYAFKDIKNSGARLRDNQRMTHSSLEYHNVYHWPIKNFLTLEDFTSALLEVAQKFNFTLDLSDFDEVYKAWCTQNTILQTQDAVKKYQNGDTSIKLDILQQAYVDANKS